MHTVYYIGSMHAGLWDEIQVKVGEMFLYTSTSDVKDFDKVLRITGFSGDLLFILL